MTARTYTSPEAFKQALEQRLRSVAMSSDAFARNRQLLVFDRFLARIVAVFGTAATLKGGLVLELRLDLALLATAQALDAKRLRAALEQTFLFRKTHALPAAVPQPIEAWRAPYMAMARDDQLPWATLQDVTQAVRAFLGPVLAAPIDGHWHPSRWAWSQ